MPDDATSPGSPGGVRLCRLPSWQRCGPVLRQAEACDTALEALGQGVRVVGLVGEQAVGKSIVARRIAAQVAAPGPAQLDLVWWLRASSTDSLIVDLLELDDALNPPSDTLETRRRQQLPAQNRARQVLRDLAAGRTRVSSWMLVYDAAPSWAALSGWVPRPSGVRQHVLLTCNDLGDDADVVHPVVVAPPRLDEAIRLLTLPHMCAYLAPLDDDDDDGDGDGDGDQARVAADTVIAEATPGLLRLAKLLQPSAVACVLASCILNDPWSADQIADAVQQRLQLVAQAGRAHAELAAMASLSIQGAPALAVELMSAASLCDLHDGVAASMLRSFLPVDTPNRAFLSALQFLEDRGLLVREEAVLHAPSSLAAVVVQHIADTNSMPAVLPRVSQPLAEECASLGSTLDGDPAAWAVVQRMMPHVLSVLRHAFDTATAHGTVVTLAATARWYRTQRMGSASRAASLALQLSEYAEAAWPRRSNTHYGDALSQVGEALLSVERYSDAVDALDRALSVHRRAVAAKPTSQRRNLALASTLAAKATAYEATQRFAAALDLADQAIALCDDTEIEQVRQRNSGESEEERRQKEQVEADMVSRGSRRSRRSRRSTASTSSATRARTKPVPPVSLLSLLVRLCLAQPQPQLQRAALLAEVAVQRAVRMYGEDSKDTLRIVALAVRAFVEAGNLHAGIQLCMDSVKVYALLDGPTALTCVDAMLTQAELHAKLEEYSDSLMVATRAQHVLKQNSRDNTDDATWRRAVVLSAQASIGVGDVATALRLLDGIRGHVAAHDSLGDQVLVLSLTASAHNRLPGGLHKRSAITLQQRVVKMLRRQYGLDHPHTEQAIAVLDEMFDSMSAPPTPDRRFSGPPALARGPSSPPESPAPAQRRLSFDDGAAAHDDKDDDDDDDDDDNNDDDDDDIDETRPRSREGLPPPPGQPPSVTSTIDDEQSQGSSDDDDDDDDDGDDGDVGARAATDAGIDADVHADHGDAALQHGAPTRGMSLLDLIEPRLEREGEPVDDTGAGVALLPAHPSAVYR